MKPTYKHEDGGVFLGTHTTHYINKESSTCDLYFCAESDSLVIARFGNEAYEYYSEGGSIQITGNSFIYNARLIAEKKGLLVNKWCINPHTGKQFIETI